MRASTRARGQADWQTGRQTTDGGGVPVHGPEIAVGRPAGGL